MAIGLDDYYASRGWTADGIPTVERLKRLVLGNLAYIAEKAMKAAEQANLKEATKMVRPQDRKFVTADPEKCIGCVVCEYACSMVNENTFNPTKSRIRAMRMGPLVNLAITCRHCEDPACVAACPRDA